MRKQGLLLGAVFGLVFVSSAFADGAMISSPSSLLNGLTFNANFDGYYGYNFNHPATLSSTNPNSLQPSQNGAFRAFDQYSNQFTLNLAELEVSKKGKEAGLLIDLDFGNQAETFANSGGPYVGTGTSVDDVSKNIGQAYITYSPSDVPRLSFKFGKFYAPVGWESTKAKDDWQYSRSILYTAGSPYWFTGLEATYSLVPGKLTASALVFDGWNTLYSVNSGKNFGGELVWTPSDSLALTYNLVSGPKQPQDNADWKTVHEANVTYALSETFALAGDILAGMTNNDTTLTGAPVARATWQALEIATKVQFSSRWYLSPRFETYWDHEGFTTGTPQTLQEVTLTNGLDLGDGLGTRVEVRYDHSTAQAFESSSGVQGNQVTGAVALLYTL